MLLGENGLVIVNQGRVIATDGDQEFDPAKSNYAIANNSLTADTQPNAIWTMVPTSNKPDESLFFLELNQGEIKPRLVRIKNSNFIRVTTRDSDGYSDATLNSWKVFPTTVCN